MLTPDLLQQIIDQLPMSIFCRDSHGRYLFANQMFANEAKLDSPAEVIGKTDAQMPWGDVFRHEDELLLAGNTPQLYQQLCCNRGTDTCWMEAHKIPLYSPQGEACAVFGMVSEIAQRKSLEQTVKNQQVLQRFLLDAIPDLIRFDDHDGVLLECNQAFLDFIGQGAEEVLGKQTPYRLAAPQGMGNGECCLLDTQHRIISEKVAKGKCLLPT